MSLSPYARYHQIMASIRFLHGGYRLRHVLASDVAMIVYGQLAASAKLLVKAFMARRFDGLEGNDSRMLAVIGPHYGQRREYKEILAFIKDVAGVEDFYGLDGVGWKLHINPLNLLAAIRLAWKVPGLQLSERITLASVAAFKLNTIDVLDGKRLSHRALLAFSAVHSDEAMFVEYFRKRGRRTYSLHHGAYGLYRMADKPIDMLAYENLNADFHLCWGQFTKDEFSEFGIESERLLVAGYPRTTRKLHPQQIPGAPLSLVFFCARWKFDAQNQRVLQLLAELVHSRPESFRVAIKPHPSLSLAEYKRLAAENHFEFIEHKTIGELLQDPDYHMAITCNSNAYYDAYLSNRIALRYVDETNELTNAILDDGFTDFESLRVKLEKLSVATESPELWSAVSSQLAYLVGYGVNRYGEILGVNEVNGQ